jgi:tRNA1(Val) A37 N6-methylase TrmN6
VKSLAPAEAVDETGFLGGQVKLRQPRRGHRAGTDAALLVAAARPYAKGRLADLGSGVGAIGVSLAKLDPMLEAVLIEIDHLLARLAAETAAANGCALRLRVLETDVRLLQGDAQALPGLAASCDLVVTNPPFTNARGQRSSPDALRAKAHLMSEEELGAWIGAACGLLKPKGRLVLIHRPDGLAALLKALLPAFGAIALRPVHPHAADSATRILVLARKSARAPLSILPPLILHEADGAFTPLAAAIHRGEAELRFD